MQHSLPRHAVADDDGEVPEVGDCGWIAEAVCRRTPTRCTRTPRRSPSKAVDAHLQRPRLTPAGGLYTVVDIGTDAEEFVPRALKATGVLVVPGGGFGPSLTNGVRISFGPLVRDTAKIDEGLARLGAWMRSTNP